MSIQMDELLPFNERIESICLISDSTVKDSTVIPAGRHRNNYILAITKIIDAIKGVSYKIQNDKAQWSIRSTDIVELISAINIVPDEYLNDELTNSMDMLRENLSRQKTKSDGMGSFDNELLNSVITGIFTLIRDLREDMPKVLITGLLYGAGVGNMLSIQPKMKVKACGTCPSPEYASLISMILNSRAKNLFDIEHSMSSRTEMTNPSYSTADAIMTQRSRFMPLEYVKRNSNMIENVLSDYDPAKLLVSPQQWFVTNSDDSLNDVIIMFETGLETKAKSIPKKYSNNIQFCEAFENGSKIIPVAGTNGTICTFSHDTPKKQESIIKSSSKFTRDELKRHFEYIIIMSNLEETVRTYMLKHSSRYSMYGMNNKRLLNDKIIDELSDLLEDQNLRISDKDMRLCFGDEIVEKIFHRGLTFNGNDINLFDDEDYLSEFKNMREKLMQSEAVVEDKTEENVKDYVFLTTTHKRATFSMIFTKFTKVITIYDESSTQLVKQKIQPGGHYSFYCKYIGLQKDVVKTDTQMFLLTLKSTVRYRDLSWCENLPFIELFNKYDVDMDSEKLETWNSISTGITTSPVLNIKDLADLEGNKDLVKCILVNMWMNEILRPLQQYVGQIDDMMRNKDVLIAYKLKAPKLYKIVSVAGASTFVSGAHIPRDSKEDMFYYLLTQIVLIPSILRHGILGVEEAGSQSNVLKTMNNYIRSIQEP